MEGVILGLLAAVLYGIGTFLQKLFQMRIRIFSGSL